ncbi:MAG: hypothetical protein JWN15_3140 [Firmicutes bacterium]|nr:hypothetical protein [Bacillota bacterium]
MLPKRVQFRISLGTLLVAVALAVSACTGSANAPTKESKSPAPFGIRDKPQSPPIPRQPTLAQPLDVQIVGKGFSQIPPDFTGTSYRTYAVVIRNPNPETWIADGVELNLTFTDASGKVVDSFVDIIDAILPGQSAAATPLAGIGSGEKVASQLQVQPHVERWEQTPPSLGRFIVSEITTVPKDFGIEMMTRATIHSSFYKDVKQANAAAVYYDSEGNIVGGASTSVDCIPANGDAELGVSADLKLDTIAKTEIYVQLTRQALLDMAK